MKNEREKKKTCSLSMDKSAKVLDLFQYRIPFCFELHHVLNALWLRRNCLLSFPLQVKVICTFFYIIPEMEISRIGQRIMDELIRPLRQVQLDENEYACLKTIVFFDPRELTYV